GGRGVGCVACAGRGRRGPGGVGALWGRPGLLETLPPGRTGGSMIGVVTMEETTFAAPPQRFEAGTMMTSQVVGLGAAVKYLSAIGMDAIAAHEHELTVAALDALKKIDGVTIIGPDTAENRGAAISFQVEGIHPHDLGQVLDDRGVCIRVGHHCAWPVHRALGVQSTPRASLYLYNTRDENDALADAIVAAQNIFALN